MISNPGIRALAEFRHALRHFVSFSEEAARRAGVSPQQHQALLALKALPAQTSTSVGELAARLCIRHHSAVGLANRLSARGFVRRLRDTDDRRQVHLQLTEEGEALIKRLSAAHRGELRRIGPELTRLLRVLASD